MKITVLRLDQFKRPVRNVRHHPQKQIEEMKRSLTMFGQTRPMVVDDEYTVLVGNGMMTAMEQLGWTEAECYVYEGLSPAQKKKLMLADNRVYDLGLTDMDAFDAILQELAGVKKKFLRLCAFFGDCGTQGLRWIAETDPKLWERIERREPNAYLVLLYWDSEMFRRNTEKRREMEGEAEDRDYKAMVEDVLFKHTDRYMIPPDTFKQLKHWRTLFKKTYGIATDEHYKRMYEALLYGDPKNRVLRIMWNNIFIDYKDSLTAEELRGGALHG